MNCQKKNGRRFEDPDSENHILFLNRFVIKNRIGKGSFGHVYHVVDCENVDRKLIAKIQDDKDQHKIETKFFKDAKKKFLHDLDKEIIAQKA